MKVLAVVMAILAVIYFLPALMQRTDSISGANRTAAYKSAIKVKKYLSTDDRVLFDTAFGLLDKIKSEESPDAFVAAVDGKKSDEIIEMAKHEVNVKIASGHPDFKQYSSWDDMVAKLTESNKKPGHTAESRTLRLYAVRSVKDGRNSATAQPSGCGKLPGSFDC